MQKFCRACKEAKPLELLVKDKNSTLGRTAWCKECKNAKSRKGTPTGAPKGNSNAAGNRRAPTDMVALDGVFLQDHRGRYLRISRIVNNIRKCGYRREKTWTLSNVEAGRLLLQPCHYCGKSSEHLDKEALNPYNGIDRLDSALGYTPDNVITSCRTCNKAKLDSSYSDFKEWIERVYNVLYK